MSAKSATGMQEPILNSYMSNLWKPLTVIQYYNDLEVIYGFSIASCFSKDTPTSSLKWKNRSRTEQDIPLLIRSFERYVQNYIKLHFFAYFTCTVFALHISTTKNEE